MVINRRVTARFTLVQEDGVGRTWTDPELTKALADFLRIWAGTVGGNTNHLYITVLKPTR